MDSRVIAPNGADYAGEVSFVGEAHFRSFDASFRRGDLKIAGQAIRRTFVDVR
jgi:hypothetical protein